MKKRLVRCGIYKNRKNGKLYFITGITNTDSETMEDRVEYFALYNEEKWSRSLSKFLEEKEPGNPKSTRFEFLVSVPGDWDTCPLRQVFTSQKSQCRILSIEWDEDDLIVVKIRKYIGVESVDVTHIFSDFILEYHKASW
jgi:hypothetical protein